MTLLGRLEQLCRESGDIEITSIDLETMSASVLLPYELAEVSIELEGSSDDDIIESFKEGVNKRLDDMINHLTDCKF